MKAYDWAIINDGYSDNLARLEKVTEKQARYLMERYSHVRTCSKDAVLFFSEDEAAVRRRLEQLKSARAECTRRESAARDWLRTRRAEILA